jgi:hypothetical protein
MAWTTFSCEPELGQPVAARSINHPLEQKMVSKQEEKPEAGTGRPERDRLNAVIGKHVIHRLGRPNDLLSVQVRRLWDACYRVNVLVGTEAASARIAQSFFLQADGEGNILAATPEITRRYEPGGTFKTSSPEP